MLTTTNAVIPNAMIRTVSTVRSILLRTDRNAIDRISLNFIYLVQSKEVGQFKVIKFDNWLNKKRAATKPPFSITGKIIYEGSMLRRSFLQYPANDTCSLDL